MQYRYDVVMIQIIKRSITQIALWLNEGMPTLDENETFERKVTLDKITALNRMKNGPTPGYNGNTIECMQLFWSKIRFVVTISSIEAFDIEEPSHTVKQSVIILVHKGKKLDIKS